MEAQAALRAAHNITALVIGDVMLDAYLIGHVNRISPEAPVPIVDVQKRERRLGGAANVVQNLVALGARVHVGSVVGHDEPGQELERLLNTLDIGTDALVRVEHRPTTVKTRVISNGQQLLRVDEENSADLDAETSDMLIQACTEVMDSHAIDVVIFEDYNKGTLTERAIKKLISACQARNIKTAVDPKFRNFLAYEGVSLFKPNFKELQEGLGLAIHKGSDASLEHAILRLCHALNPGLAMVTLSERGVCFASVVSKIPFCRIPAFEREITDVSGAGDAVIAVASVLLALDVPPWQIAAVANLAGGLVCEKVGVVPVDLQRLQSEWEANRPMLESRLNVS